MNAPPRRDEAADPGQARLREDQNNSRQSHKHNMSWSPREQAKRPLVVTAVAEGRRTPWGRFASRVEADRIAAHDCSRMSRRCRGRRMNLDKRAPHLIPEPPEHRYERRRFLIWACMAGLVGPERVVERVLADV